MQSLKSGNVFTYFSLLGLVGQMAHFGFSLLVDTSSEPMMSEKNKHSFILAFPLFPVL